MTHPQVTEINPPDTFSAVYSRSRWRRVEGRFIKTHKVEWPDAWPIDPACYWNHLEASALDRSSPQLECRWIHSLTLERWAGEPATTTTISSLLASSLEVQSRPSSPICEPAYLGRLPLFFDSHAVRRRDHSCEPSRSQEPGRFTPVLSTV